MLTLDPLPKLGMLDLVEYMDKSMTRSFFETAECREDCIEYEGSALAIDQIYRLSALMLREELVALTGTKQPKRMCAWLEARGWAHEPPERRGDIPKVLRAYRDARLSGIQSERTKRANYSFMTERSR